MPGTGRGIPGLGDVGTGTAGHRTATAAARAAWPRPKGPAKGAGSARRKSKAASSLALGCLRAPCVSSTALGICSGAGAVGFFFLASGFSDRLLHVRAGPGAALQGSSRRRVGCGRGGQTRRHTAKGVRVGRRCRSCWHSVLPPALGKTWSFCNLNTNART